MNQRGRILVIDDEAALRQTLARILQREGHEVTTAESGEMGLSLLANTPFDLVYMDLRMPGMAGLDTLKAIHTSQPNLPVILFTAQPDMQSAVEALRLGATDYLLKPLQPEVLIERTRKTLIGLEKDRRRREIQAQIDSLQTELKKLEADETISPLDVPASVNEERFLSRGKLTLDLHTRRVTVGKRVVNLPPTAFDYLLVLARHAPNVVDYQTLVTEAQGYQADVREAQELVKWHIHHIRQAIEADAQNPAFIINVRGSGYRFVAD
ncbi:MAG: DNA-binding response regulator [Anaerolineaceae bacterium]|nr:MAG: DNA-binding response regulator [Anaerolineaceae bacterium]